MAEHFQRPLVGAAELAAALDRGSRPVLLDVRWQLGGPSQHPEYLAGHLPGARWCDLEVDLADPPGVGGRHPLPDPARLQAALRAWGVEEQSEVVVYDQGNSVAAARAWWVLRWAGVAAVRVLDGGYQAWLAAGLPVQTQVPQPAAGSITVRPGSLPTLDAGSAADRGRAGRLVDVRAAERFLGEVEPIDPVAGHIPGAVNLPTTENVEPSGRFRSEAELRERFAAAGITGADPAAGGDPAGGDRAGGDHADRDGSGAADSTPVGVYCGSGITAAHTVLAMRVAGIDAVLYPGSWSEWVTDPSRPVETGGPTPAAGDG